MKQMMIALSLLVMSATALADRPNDKILVCHVGSTLSSIEEDYMLNPDCTIPDGWDEGIDGEFTCPDAGKIDLILVSSKAKHIGNDSHAYGNDSDYAPLIANAGADPADFEDNTVPLDGIDDGCEAPIPLTCSDGVQNGLEEGVDCGLLACGITCQGTDSCSDGVQNGAEVGVDCGPVCGTTCPGTDTCSDGVQNGAEEGVDCGGACAVYCPTPEG